ncbi:IclR family transcriptional regulator [Georgenia deserti]|uniref:IclR family transcriptional regulator n=1 Tax=Georgenia deserti TaxID=2093781 RepID=A0ABW4L2C3_9MICO
MSTETTRPARPVQSVDRALYVLEILARETESSLGQLADELGVHKSTVSRLVDVLSGHDLVEQDQGRYRLGVGCLRLAGATAGRLSVTTEAQPVCDRLAAELDETCNVAILSSGMAVNVCQAEGSTTIGTRNWIGQRTPPHATSNGKVLLAHLPEEQRHEAVSGPLERFTDRTLTDPADLEAALARIRTDGYAYAEEEYEEGLFAVAAPIRDHTGTVVAALSAAGPGYRVTEEEFPHIRDAVMWGAAEVSRRLGGRAS